MGEGSIRILPASPRHEGAEVGGCNTEKKWVKGRCPLRGAGPRRPCRVQGRALQEGSAEGIYPLGRDIKGQRPLTFDGTDHDALDEETLEEGVDQQNGEGDDHGHRHLHGQGSLLGGDVGQGVGVLGVADQRRQ